MAFIQDTESLDDTYEIAEKILICPKASEDDQTKAAGFKSQVDTWASASTKQVKMINAIGAKLKLASFNQLAPKHIIAAETPQPQNDLNKLLKAMKKNPEKSDPAKEYLAQRRASILAQMEVLLSELDQINAAEGSL